MAKKANATKSKAVKTKKSGKASAPKKVAASRAPAVKPRIIKSPFSKSEQAEFRRMLLEKRRSILGDMGGIEAEALRTNRQEASGDLSNMPTHPADIGTDNYEQEFTLGLLESERTLLTEINEALERIDNNTYGVCLGTGQPIGKARLKARPWAKYCIEYARMLEKGLIRPSGESAGTRSESDQDQDEESSEDSAALDDAAADDVEIEEEIEE